jgi:hypothetical protein
MDSLKVDIREDTNREGTEVIKEVDTSREVMEDIRELDKVFPAPQGITVNLKLDSKVVSLLEHNSSNLNNHLRLLKRIELLSQVDKVISPPALDPVQVKPSA